ncbi:hypothetical protein MHUMG1_08566 [Metarhizium humberi]|uniref:Dipeptidase n=1 Tax=Metarhizium humberi TaxID=2596975 RepID=A0A9P8M6P2_9HYPO|nr:hypothetical protein MHUMG1_08566 [Metarhizium humberi]
MGGKLLVAPANLDLPNLRILDSGTAQANWLLDLAAVVPDTARLVGTDIATGQFPPEAQRPSNMTLQTQSIFEPWDKSMVGSFDIVHQRFVLAACRSDEQAQRAVASLVTLAKPGGWIELHEGNMLSIQEGEAHRAMMRFRDIAVAAWASIGQLPDPGVRLAGWLRGAGATQVHALVQTVSLGAAASNALEAEWSTELCLNMLRTMKRMTAVRRTGKADFPDEREFDRLEEELRDELQRVGNQWCYYLALKPPEAQRQSLVIMDKMGSTEHSSLEQALELMSRVPLIGIHPLLPADVPKRQLVFNVFRIADLPADGHNDWMHMIRAYYDFQVDERFESQRDLAGHVDLKRLVEGRAGAVFWSVYVECPKEEDDFSDALHLYSLRDTVQQIDLLYRIVDLYPDKLEIVHKSQDIMRIFKSGKCASLVGAEGLHQIGNSSSALRIFHRLGVRYVTLAHGKNNLYVDSATSKAPVHHGLSSHGRDMVREMNRIGIHKHNDMPFSLTQVSFRTSSYALVPHARNVPDHVLDLLKENGGIIMISFIPWLTNKEPEKSTVDDVVDHIVYVGDRIGYHHLGLGSDFDGMPTHVQGLEDVSKYPNVVARMLERGISPEDVEKVIGLNLIRVLRDVEEFAASHRRSISVLEDRVPQLWDDGIRTHVKRLYPNAEHDKPHGNMG